MNLRTRIATWLLRGVHPRDPALADWLGGAMTAAGVSVTADSAMRIAAVYSCIRVLSETLAGLPLIVYRRKKGGGKERATDHWLYPLLHIAPNGWMTSFAWREMGMAHLGLRGVAYSRIVGDPRGRRQLIPMHPDRVRTVLLDSGRLAYEYQQQNGGFITLLQDEVLRIPFMTLDGVRPVTPIQAQRETLGASMASQDYGARFWANDARPTGGWVEMEGDFKDDASSKSFREKWQKAMTGENRHKTVFLPKGMKYNPLSLTMEDAQFLETRKFQRSEVAGIYRVPPHMIGDLERATFCLPAGEPVFTATGPVPIERVRPGDLVWSRDDSGGLTLSPVKHSVATGVDPILTIRTTNRTIRCNAKHPILCRTKVLSPALAGSFGGAIVDGEYHRVEWESRYVPAGELAIGDTVVCLDRLPDTGSLDVCPTRVPSVEFMEFCGLLLGDGNVIDGASAKYVTIARADHATYMDHYRGVIAREFRGFRGRGNGRNRAEGETSPVHLQEGERQTRFSSVLAVEELKAIGFGGNARTKRVPGWVFQLPEAHRLAFLRGYLDADGSVDKMGRMSFSSVGEEMLSQIRHLCISCGIPVTNLRNQTGTTTLPNGERKEFSVWTFTCSDPAANRRVGSHTPEYVRRMNEGKPFERRERNYPRYGGKGFDESGLSLARIASIEIGPPEAVYDLEVADTHSFIASGVVVHNSNVEQQSIDFVVYTMQPWLVRWEQELSRGLLSEAEQEEYYVEFLVDGLLRGDATARANYFRTAVLTGWMNRNEVREIENMNRADGLDEYLTPLNMTPADLLADAIKGKMQ